MPSDFSSDNCARVHPKIMKALELANTGTEASYGYDRHTAELGNVCREHFGSHAEAFPVFNGTGANVLALQSMVSRWGAVICAGWAHINTDEGGAPEKVGGIKLLPVTNLTGKLTPEDVRGQARNFGDEHHVQPEVLSLSVTSELGRVYSIAELTDLCATAHELGLLVHIDGARISNAAAALGLSLRAVTTDVGADMLSFGGTKNGLMYGELVVALSDRVDPGSLRYLRKSGMQLASKMRYISAQFIELLRKELWLLNAGSANSTAAQLSLGLTAIEGVTLFVPTEANAVFAVLPPAAAEVASRDFGCLILDKNSGAMRIMTSFDTSPQDVEIFLAHVGEAVR